MPATLTVKPWHDPVVDILGHDPVGAENSSGMLSRRFADVI
jgi:hypothetical protein